MFKNMQIKINKEYCRVCGVFIAAMCSAYVFAADFSVNYMEYTIEDGQSCILNILSCFNSVLDGSEVLFSILTISLFCLYNKLRIQCVFFQKEFVMTAGILSLLTMLYYPYTFGSSLAFLISTKFQMIQTVLFISGYFFLFHVMVNVLYNYIISVKAVREKDCSSGIKNYIKTVMKLAVLWLPNVIVKLPGAFCPDSVWQLKQGLRLMQFTSHHPPFHTFVLRVCALAGYKLAGSYNVGVTFFILIQYFIMAAVFGYAIYYLEKKGVSKFGKYMIWAIYCISPFVISCIGIVLKDVIYSTFCFAFVIFLVQYIDNDKELSVGTMTGLILSTVLTDLTRNNGKEIVYPVLFIIVTIAIVRNRKNLKQVFMACTVFLLSVILSFTISKGLETHYDIWEGSIAEALSFPFQQTARTVLEHSDEISLEEKEIIDKVLEYDTLAEKYNPLISDQIKGGFKGWDNANMRAYAKVWLRQFLRWPMTYCEAALNQNYPIFCLLMNEQRYYHNSNVSYEENEIIHEYPFLEKIDGAFEMFYKILNKLPVISFLSNTSFWCVMLIILSAFVLKDREYCFLLILFPLWLTIVCILLGPVASSRYAYPIAYSMPFVMWYYALRNCRNEKDRNDGAAKKA